MAQFPSGSGILIVILSGWVLTEAVCLCHCLSDTISELSRCALLSCNKKMRSLKCEALILYLEVKGKLPTIYNLKKISSALLGS